MATENREHKDRLFRFVFNDRTKLLSLYNALNHSNYQDENELEFNTLDDFIYMGMRNDISFILGSEMCLYEHQSTCNPNMPLRGLFYFSDLLQKYVAKESYNIYGTTLIKLPTPRFIVFYNGLKAVPEQSILRLSDAFIDQNKKGCLEVEVTMLNINIGKNRELMESCKYLKEYAAFVGKVREYNYEGLPAKAAINQAVEYCIKHDVMKEVLLQHKAEVAQLIFREFDEEEYRRYTERKRKEEAKELAEKLAERMAERMAKRMAKQMAEEQAKELAEKLAEQMAEEQAQRYEKQVHQLEEQAKAETNQAKAEIERLRKILAEHGLTE